MPRNCLSEEGQKVPKGRISISKSQVIFGSILTHALAFLWHVGPYTTDGTPQKVANSKGNGTPAISGKSRLVKYYCIWLDISNRKYGYQVDSNNALVVEGHGFPEITRLTINAYSVGGTPKVQASDVNLIPKKSLLLELPTTTLQLVGYN